MRVQWKWKINTAITIKIEEGLDYWTNFQLKQIKLSFFSCNLGEKKKNKIDQLARNHIHNPH